ncbi:hypothetical protein D9756_008535 [Leucocoprinus leucothites]|uniref:SWIM-type domain-containing protein n=1 Tax=Leucocoprinus leucothites TaxID=201217 RepID=A0A8H5FUR7_9AGAR|nr:hypothetical protein D9756_008535 [Leucoagaricus leucothites]
MLDIINIHNNDASEPHASSCLYGIQHAVQDRSRDFSGFAALVCLRDHYTAYRLLPSGERLEFGDSLQGGSNRSREDALDWAVNAPHFSFTSPAQGQVNPQGTSSGSCGVASLNFIHQAINPTVPQWSSERSNIFRALYLDGLIAYHVVAAKNLYSHSQWTHRLYPAAPPVSEHDVGETDLVPYEDFNLFLPTKFHPIHTFLNESQTLSPAPPASSSALSVPSSPQADVQCKFEPQAATMKLEELTPTILPAPTIAPRPTPKVEQVDIKLEDVPTPLPPPLFSPTMIKSEDTLQSPSLFYQPSTTDSEIIDLTCDSPCSSPTRTFSMVIDLTNSVTPSPNKPSIDTNSGSSPVITSTKNTQVKPENLPSSQDRPSLQVNTPLRLHTPYSTCEAAEEAVYAAENALGFSWHRSQLHRNDDGDIIKCTVHCSGYAKPEPTHSDKIDPGDWRQGKSRRSECMAHVNIRSQAGGVFWTLTHIDLQHNHPPPFPTWCHAATTSQAFAAEACGQITNLINAARRKAHEPTNLHGGDFAAVLSYLQRLKQEDPGWDYRLQLDKSNTVVALWWQSPEQGQLSQRYWDILICDMAYNCNVYGYALNIGVIIDNVGKLRNVWYCLQKSESVAMHTWVLQNHLDVAKQAPEVFASDRHISLCIAVPSVMPFTQHIYCLHHLTSNVNSNLCTRVGHENWVSFNQAFWVVYRATSPEVFDRLWRELGEKYPGAKPYLDDELYPCRQHWAWPWISHMFTAGQFGGPKKTALQLVQALNERTLEQTQKEEQYMRELSRRQHVSNLETLFAHPLRLLRQHAGPFALQTCYKQMVESMFYTTEVIQRPPDSREWNYLISEPVAQPGFEWADNEESKLMNPFTNDRAHISTTWLFNLINNLKLRIHQLFKVTHQATGAAHYLVRLTDDRCICDCCMGMNLGVPCRHFFNAWVRIKGLPFHLGLVRARWYKTPSVDLAAIPVVTQHGELSAEELRLKDSLASASNPIKWAGRRNQGNRTPSCTQTLGAREVHQTVQAAFRPMLAGLQTQDQVEVFIERMIQAQQKADDAERAELIKDPLPLKLVGQPRTARITGASEPGRSRGGGPTGPRLPPGWPVRAARTTAELAGSKDTAAPGAPLVVN